MPSHALLAAAVLAGVSRVAAHGFVDEIIVNGVSYGGYFPNHYPYQSNPPTVVAWSQQQLDLGFIAPDEYTSRDIICHRDADNAGGHATVQAGDHIFLSWDRWPSGHLGPILDYLAYCGDANCEDVDMEALEFFKIDEAGLKNPDEFWTETLLENMGWMIQIPESLRPGNYVLRHELIALHSAHEHGGAQNYPQCFNLRVEGSGNTLPDGIPATQFYTPDDAGIDISIYGGLSSYPIPGPPVADIGGMVEQTVSQATTTASPTLPGADRPTGSAGQDSDNANNGDTAPAPTAPPQEDDDDFEYEDVCTRRKVKRSQRARRHE